MHIQLARLGAFLSILLLAFPAQAVTFWEDNFESQLNAGGNGPWITIQCVEYRGIPAPAADGCTEFNNPARITFGAAFSGTHVLVSDFDGPTYPDGGHGTKGSMIFRQHPIVTAGGHHWMRAWYRRSSSYVGFTTSSTFSKVFYLRNQSGGASPIWNQDKSGRFFLTSQPGGNVWCPTFNKITNSCNYWSNTGHNPSFQADKWYCLEFHIGLGSVGTQTGDGVVEMWVDGAKTLDYQNAGILGAPTSLSSIGVITQQADSGERYIDNLAVGNTRIGCSGSPPATPPAPAPAPAPAPPPPQNLRVQ